jgi:hypothetical protein
VAVMRVRLRGAVVPGAERGALPEAAAEAEAEAVGVGVVL